MYRIISPFLIFFSLFFQKFKDVRIIFSPSLENEKKWGRERHALFSTEYFSLIFSKNTKVISPTSEFFRNTFRHQRHSQFALTFLGLRNNEFREGDDGFSGGFRKTRGREREEGTISFSFFPFKEINYNTRNQISQEIGKLEIRI